jgi:hypothetical protein
MKCKWCETETNVEYCSNCKNIREAFEKVEESEKRFAAFKKILLME